MPPRTGRDPYAAFLRSFAISHKMQQSKGLMSHLKSSTLSRLPHSNACVATTLNDLMTEKL
jgi:hypothetical protein